MDSTDPSFRILHDAGSSLICDIVRNKISAFLKGYVWDHRFLTAFKDATAEVLATHKKTVPFLVLFCIIGTLVIVTHDADIAAQADQVVAFKDGQLVRDHQVHKKLVKSAAPTSQHEHA